MNLPIAMFHHVDRNPVKSLKGWTISPEKFKLFLDCIVAKGYETITFEDIKALVPGTSKSKKIILTFDDCPASLFDYAIPELLKREMKAVFFIPTAHIGGINHWDVMEQGFEPINLMTSDQLKYLTLQGMEIGSHGHYHKRAVVDQKILAEEIYHSKAVLSKLLNKKIISFAYPYGEIPRNYRDLLKTAGYQFAIGIYSRWQTKLSLRRFGIHQTDTEWSMTFKLGNTYRFMRFFSDPVLRFFKIA